MKNGILYLTVINRNNNDRTYQFEREFGSIQLFHRIDQFLVDAISMQRDVPIRISDDPAHRSHNECLQRRHRKNNRFPHALRTSQKWQLPRTQASTNNCDLVLKCSAVTTSDTIIVSFLILH